MRTAFLSELCALAESDTRIWLLTGDLGFSVLEPFAERFPDRFVNVGVAEQNMIGVAAGIAMCGNVVFTYSIGNFATLRCLEQIRLDVCYHSANVKIVSVGAGYSYASLGYSHHAIEDLGIMAALPNLAVASPADPAEARWITKLAAERTGPMYLRVGKAGESTIHQHEITGSFGDALYMRRGEDLSFIAIGSVAAVAVQAADRLRMEGVSCSVLSVPFLHPLDVDCLTREAQRTKRVIVVEEHNSSGLTATVSGVLFRHCVHAQFKAHSLDASIQFRAGGQEEFRARAGLTVDALMLSARELVRPAAVI